MMNGMDFTARFSAVLYRAREESVRLRHEYIGTEHILLALLGEEQGIPPNVLRQCGIEPQQIREKIEEIVRPGNRESTTGPDLPFTSRGKKVLELTLAEALRARADAAD